MMDRFIYNEGFLSFYCDEFVTQMWIIIWKGFLIIKFSKWWELSFSTAC